MQAYSGQIETSRTAPAAARDLRYYIAGEAAALRAGFESGRTRSYEWRVEQLGNLQRLVEENEGALIAALQADLKKPSIDAWTSEIHEVVSAVKNLRKNLKKWMRATRAPTPLALQPGRSFIQPEPLGVVLVIAPWNYPMNLLLNPLAGALAAGNAVMLKPSEVAAATSACLTQLVRKYLDPQAVRIVEGAVAETTELLAQRWDHIFYTGNGTVGRIVMEAAAKHLTPVTLELGGKSPCIVDEQVDLEVAARRVVWGKFFNCGQTCIAPDYLLVHDKVHDRFVELLQQTVKAFWSERPETSADYGRIINARHLRRLVGLIPGSGELVTGGQSDEASLYLAPTILKNVAPDSPVMRDEIFGPILPVLRISSIDQAISFINARPKPLALYVFSSTDETQQRVLAKTSSGGVVINHALLHFTSQGLPFGGVGESGMGAYHGKSSFDTFSHKKAVLKKSTMVDPSLMYPPYTPSKEGWIKRLL
ncbi:MAG: NAD-dependent aldehyde dehydrogenase [Myxococcaceae bacterium]|nr:NAD-dependent aldehyde dehydrogenase [Myxococcaceae bacterium]